MINYVPAIFGFIIGSVMGSFIHAVALRTVKDIKWWGSERSLCPQCKHTLGFWDLIPLFSWLFLRGRCRYCGKPIPPAYFAAELITAILTSAIFIRWATAPAALFLSLAAMWFMIFHAITDLYSQYIYDGFALACGIVGMALRIFGGWKALGDGVLGASVGWLPLAALIFCTRGKMGWGDANLMAGLGACLGLKMTLTAMYCGFMTGGLIAVVLLIAHKVGRKDALPMAPSLTAGTFITLIWGPQLLQYLRFLLWWPWLE